MNYFLGMRRNPRRFHVGRVPTLLIPNVAMAGRPNVCGAKHRKMHARGAVLVIPSRRARFNACCGFRPLALYPVSGRTVLASVLDSRRVA